MNFTKSGSPTAKKIFAYNLVLIALTLTSGIACVKTIDVPSLHEQLEGEWQVASYTEERYVSTTNTVSRNEVAGRPGDRMRFSDRDRLFVSFDTAAPVTWTYRVTDARTLSIEGKSWTIQQLDAQQLHLSSNQRDSSFKVRDVVRYHLVR